MVLKSKLSLGIGFLFIIILVLMGLSTYYVEKLSNESENILKDNYNSIVYSKNMLLALDNMHTSISANIFNPDTINKSAGYYANLFEAAKIEFEKNLKSENNNITELQEKDFVDMLNKTYDIYLNLGMQIKKGTGGNVMYFNEMLPAYEKLRQTISNINDINMQAVVRKNEITKKDATTMINCMAIIAVICVILAFGYFWYFPFYVSNSISILSDKMKGLLKVAGIAYDFKSNDEMLIIWQSINLLQNKLSSQGK
jgi:hypothetical protein